MPRPISSRSVSHGTLAAALVAALLFAVDRKPRFMLGDSVSYLTSGWRGSFPPDRSWLYGLAARELMLVTHSLRAAIVLHTAGLVLVVFSLGRSFPSAVRPRTCLVAAGLGIACDPLIETYARFSMSDLSAALLFAGFLCSVSLCLASNIPGWKRSFGWIVAALFCMLAVAFRVAYAPIAIGALLVSALSCWRLPDRRHIPALLLACVLPVIGVLGLVGANRMVFADRFPGETFTNRSSGLFLMGVFSPALIASDIRAAGVQVTDAEVATMHLGDYRNRINQVWGSESFWLQPMMNARLHATADYDGRVDAAGHAMVMAALRRDSLAIIGVYLHGLRDEALPEEWRRNIGVELGLHRSLETWFVDYLDQRSDESLTSESPRQESFMTLVLERTIEFYPAWLGLGTVAALVILLGKSSVTSRLASASLLASIVTAPLYSNYVIPRYVILASLLAWLVVPQMLVQLLDAARLRSGVLVQLVASRRRVAIAVGS